jgi:hypothetical protein
VFTQRRADGTDVVVEVARTGRQRLSFQSMRIKKMGGGGGLPGTSESELRASPPPTLRRDRGPGSATASEDGAPGALRQPTPPDDQAARASIARAEEAAARPLAADAEARRQEADEALALAEADLARTLDAASPEVRAAAEAEIKAIREVSEEGAALERAAKAASACLRGN